MTFVFASLFWLCLMLVPTFVVYFVLQDIESLQADIDRCNVLLALINQLSEELEDIGNDLLEALDRNATCSKNSDNFATSFVTDPSSLSQFSESSSVHTHPTITENANSPSEILKGLNGISAITRTPDGPTFSIPSEKSETAENVSGASLVGEWQGNPAAAPAALYEWEHGAVMLVRDDQKIVLLPSERAEIAKVLLGENYEH